MGSYFPFFQFSVSQHTSAGANSLRIKREELVVGLEMTD